MLKIILLSLLLTAPQTDLGTIELRLQTVIDTIRMDAFHEGRRLNDEELDKLSQLRAEKAAARWENIQRFRLDLR